MNTDVQENENETEIQKEILKENGRKALVSLSAKEQKDLFQAEAFRKSKRKTFLEINRVSNSHQ